MRSRVPSLKHSPASVSQKILDSGGRVARFEKRYGKRAKAADK